MSGICCGYRWQIALIGLAKIVILAARGDSMTKVDDLHRKWLGDPEYARAFVDLVDEFEQAARLTQARSIQPDIDDSGGLTDI